MQQTIEGFRLSPQQERLWLLRQGNDVYRAHCSLKITGKLSVPTLFDAVETVCSRHEIYRTSFRRLSQMKFPVQVVNASPSCAWKDADLRNCSPLDQQKQLASIAREGLASPIDLEEGSFVQCTFFTLHEDEHVLFIQLHSLYADAPTLYHFTQELAHCYERGVSSVTSDNEGVGGHYLQFSEWQHALLEGKEEIDDKAHEREKNSEIISSLAFSFERKSFELACFSPAFLEVSIASELCACIDTFLEKQQSSLPDFFLACWQILLWRLTHRDDLLVGLAVDGRVYPQLATIAGPLVKDMPFPAHLTEDLSFGELLAQTNETQKKMLSQYPYFFWEDLVSTASNPSSSLSYPFAFDFREQVGRYEVEGASFFLQQCYAYSEPFKVKLIVVRSGSSLNIEIHYDANVFDRRDMYRIVRQFTTLVESAAKQPEARISELDMLSPVERRQLLIELNQTQSDSPRELCLHQLFEQQVADTPDAIAVYDDEKQLTYHGLDRWANRVAQHLQEAGVQPEVLVGLCVSRSVELLVGIFGILKAGGAYVPLDLTSPQKRLASIAADARLSILLTTNALQDSLPAIERVICLDTEGVTLAQYSGEHIFSDVAPTNLAYVIYTSGSTGQPKGVMISHQGLVNYVNWACEFYGMKEGSGTLLHTPLAFDLTVTSLFPPLVVGHPVWLAVEDAGVNALATILRAGPDFSMVKLTPAHLDLLNQLLVPTDLAATTRMLILGGEALRGESLAFWRLHAPAMRLINEYGPTETVVGCCVYEVPREGLVRGSVPIGRPIANTQIYLLDQHMQPVPLGMVAEVYIGGSGLGRGYLHRGDLTAACFVPHPFSSEPGARLYKTGDLARYVSADGDLDYVGRIDHQIKIRSYRVELGEIEVVLRTHPSVQEAVVILQEDMGEEKFLVAYVVARQGVQPSREELRGWLGQQVPDYMVPGSVIFLEVLPLTPNGKIDRQTLPTTEQNSLYQNVVTRTRTPLEEVVTVIWANLLHLSPLQISIHDNFFTLGGHSLLATRLIAQIRAMFRVELPVKAVFEAPTVAELARWVEQALRMEEAALMLPLVAEKRPEALPLSYAQQRLWFLEQLEPGSPTYLIPSALTVRGQVETKRLEQALQAVISRHESLRTTFAEQDGQPVQVIHPADASRVPVIDLQGVRDQQRDGEARRLASQEAQHPCDLVQGPLLRTTLLRLEREEHVLLLTLHHSITDGWSNEVLVRELTTLYRSFVAGQPSPLAPLPIQYADYALWQRAWLQGEVLEAQVAYWRTQLADVPPLELPTDHPRPAVQSSRGAVQSLLLPLAVSEQLVALSQQEHVTVFMTLLAAFQVLVQRYSGQNDFSVGTPIANRRQAEIEGLIGFFVNTLVLRSDLSGDPSFVELLRRVREVCLGAYAHQDVPFEQVVEALAPTRDLSRSPLFQVMLVLQNTPQEQTDLAGVQVRALEVESTVSQFDLTLWLSETGQGLHCVLEYNSDLFEAETITRLLGHWQTLLQGIVQDPQAHLWQLPLLTAGEHEQLLVHWNATQAEIPPHAGVHQLFEQQVERTPEAVALVFEEQMLTYEQLNRRANQLAHHLQKRGVGPEVLVGICMERSLEMVIGLLAVLKVGGASVPLDPAYPQDRLTFLLEDTQVALLLTVQSCVKALPASHRALFCLDSDWPLLAQESQDNVSNNVLPASLAYVMYTSGSTGRPKGVMISQHALGNRLLWGKRATQLTSSDRTLQVASLSFDIALWEVLGPLLSGACLVLADPHGYRDSSYLLSLLEREQITIAHFVPSVLQVLLHAPELARCQRLRWILYGGEASSSDLPQRIMAQSSAQLQQFYGPTEATINATYWRSDPQKPARRATIGHPIENMRVYVLDAQRHLVPIGVIGELFLGGVGLARGYWQRPDLSAERLVPDPWSQEPGARLYRTGDLARVQADGSLEYVGRRDTQVKIRGYRVELGEIEAVVREQQAVRDAVVQVRDDAGGQPWLVAYVVGAEDATAEELRRSLQEKLPAYMIPARFVWLDALPLTSNGKVDRKGLPAPEQWEADENPGQPSARTPIEEIMQGLWSSVLGRVQVGMQDNFFEVGGHSLLATQLLARVRGVLSVEIPLRTIFEEPTVAGFAQRVEELLRQGDGVQMPPLLASTRPKHVPLSYAQQRLWFLEQLEPGSPTYLIASALTVRGQVETQSLEQALQELISRHESLRTTFAEQDGQPVQVIHPAEVYRMPVIDLQGVSNEQRAAEARRLAHQEAQRPCDLVQGPLLRTALLRLEREEHVLLLTLHHIITDGWSNGVLVGELTTLYRSFVDGQSFPLAPLPIQYADYALWQRAWLQGEVLQEQIAYWKKQLWRVQPLHLPIDPPDTIFQRDRGASYSFHFPTQLSEDVMTLSRQENVTLFMLLLAAFQIVLSSVSGQEDIVVGTDIANRTQIETEGLIGFFVNLLALRTRVQSMETFRMMVQQVRAMVLDAYAHQELPFDVVVEHLAVERTTSGTPLVQVLCVLQNMPRSTEEVAGVTFASLPEERISAKFDLAFFLSEGSSGIGGTVVYRAASFKEQTIASLVHQFERLLQHVVASPESSLEELEIASREEKAELLSQKEQTYKTGRKGKALDVSAFHSALTRRKKDE